MNTESKLRDIQEYVRNRIIKYWENAWIDYRVSGKYNFSFIVKDSVWGYILNVSWVEEGTFYSMGINHIEMFTPEEVFNIWMESDWSEWADKSEA